MKPHDSLPLTDFVQYPQDEMVERAQSFYQNMARRHSVRAFSAKPVPKSILKAAISAAGTAPSGANHQPWHFALISNPETKRKVRAAAEQEEQAFYDGRGGTAWLKALAPLGTDAQKPYLETAPYLVAVFAQRRGGVTKDDSQKNYYINESVGIACGILITALHHAGLCTLTHTPKPMGFLNEICSRPKSEKPVILLIVGYPADDARIPRHAHIKKPLCDIMSEH